MAVEQLGVGRPVACFLPVWLVLQHFLRLAGLSRAPASLCPFSRSLNAEPGLGGLAALWSQLRVGGAAFKGAARYTCYQSAVEIVPVCAFQVRTLSDTFLVLC